MKKRILAVGTNATKALDNALTFKCRGCKKKTPNSQGCDDEMFAYCDDCWFDAQTLKLGLKRRAVRRTYLAKPQKKELKYFAFEFTARECRELCDALVTASASGTLPERRAYRLWLTLDSEAIPERKKR